jgi:hypothetical protein
VPNLWLSMWLLACSALASPALASPVLGVPSTHTTDDKLAAQEFKEAKTAYGRGDYRRAGELFEAANKHKPHHSALYNAALSWNDAGESVRAANLIDAYLRVAPANAKDMGVANALLATLQAKLGRLEIHGEGVTDVRLNGEPVERETVWVSPGEHAVTAIGDGKTVRKLLAVKAGEIVQASIAPPPPLPPPVVPETWERPLSPWFVVAGGAVTAVAGGFTLYQGLQTVSLKDDFLATADADKTQDGIDRVKGAQTLTNIGIGVTIGSAIITAALAVFLVNWQGKEPAKKGSARTRGLW